MDDKNKFQLLELCFKLYYELSKTLNGGHAEFDEDCFPAFYAYAAVALQEVNLSNDEKASFERHIKLIYNVCQEPGIGLVGEYNHDPHWYENLKKNEDYKEYYWPRYRDYLMKKDFNPRSLEVLGEKTLPDLMSYIGNPYEDSPFSIRGLVMGDVQSGKTSNYIGLMTKAADAGYRVIILLTGTIESLRKQTQVRVEEGFIGYDSVNAESVGVGEGDPMPRAFTSRNNDFTGNTDKNTFVKINESGCEPMVFIVKKNCSVLRKLYSSLKNINTGVGRSKIVAPLLLIDDEADNASINTRKADDDPTKINELIRKILVLFSRNTYIGYTATPFANVFISYDTQDEMLENDLFPKDFIYSLESPSSYNGPQKYFRNNGLDYDGDETEHVKHITDYDETENGELIFPINHTKDWYGNRLFGSFYHAINVFLLANAIRDIRDFDKTTHRTMLINMSRFTRVHFVIQLIADEYLDKVKCAVKQNCRYDKDTYLKNPIINGLYESFSKEYKDSLDPGNSVTWDDVFAALVDSIKNVKTVVINSSRYSTKLDYEGNKRIGLRVIAIGGLALSRGLTLEGLCVSYFYRDTSTFDVLMQMGRWFGYRNGYGDLCRVYLTRTSCVYYEEISNSIEALKKDIRIMVEKGLGPKDYGIRVRNNSSDLHITARNKSRNTSRKLVRKNFWGSVFETPYLHRDLDRILENEKHVSDFVHSVLSRIPVERSVTHPYYRNVSSDAVCTLLGSLDIHEANDNFDVTQITKFINKNPDIAFDVLFMGGRADNIGYDLVNGVGDKCVERQFDIVDRSESINSQIIRISKSKARLGGYADTQFGLSKTEIEQLPEKTKEQDFMIEGRNALFIVYFIQPKNEGQRNMSIAAVSDESASDKKLTLEDRLFVDMDKKGIRYLVGYAIAFPHKDGVFEEVDAYVVNSTCSYYDRKDEEDAEMYEEVEEDGKDMC